MTSVQSAIEPTDAVVTASSHAAKSSRNLQLDILRGIAIVLVLIRHPVMRPDEAGSLSPVAKILHNFGWTGVDLFFVLSGFLIGGLLIKEIKNSSRLDVKRFIIRRGFKIWPTYYVFLAVVCVQLVRHDHMRPKQALHAILPNLLHVQNYLGTPAGITWSLAVEEHFYITLPILLLVLLKIRPKRTLESNIIPMVTVASMIVCTILRYFTIRHILPQFSFADVPRLFRYTQLTDKWATQLRFDSLLFGVFLAYIYRVRPELLEPLKRRCVPLALIGFLLVSPMLFLPYEAPFVFIFGMVLLYLGYGCILLAFVLTPLDAGPIGRLLSSRLSRLVAFIGFYSYSIYLWHTSFALSFLWFHLHNGKPQGNHSPALYVGSMLVYIAIAVLSGVCSAAVIERPTIRLRDRLFPPRAQL